MKKKQRPKIILPQSNLLLEKRDVTVREKQNALEQFDELLKKSLSNDNKPTEEAWQKYFNNHPYVFTETIPLHFDSLYSQVIFESGRADYLIHGSARNPFFSTTGLIEIKRPHHTILRKHGNHLYLASHGAQAKQQSENYLQELQDRKILHNGTSIAIGNNRCVFIIIGTSSEIFLKCGNELFSAQFSKLLPTGFQILTYDHLFDTFRSKLPVQTMILVCNENTDNDGIDYDLKESIALFLLKNRKQLNYFSSHTHGTSFGSSSETENLPETTNTDEILHWLRYHTHITPFGDSGPPMQLVDFTNRTSLSDWFFGHSHATGMGPSGEPTYEYDTDELSDAIDLFAV